MANLLAFTQGSTLPRDQPGANVPDHLLWIGWSLFAALFTGVLTLVLGLMKPRPSGSTANEIAAQAIVVGLVFGFLIGTAAKIVGLWWVSHASTLYNSGDPRGTKHAKAIAIVAVVLGALGSIGNALPSVNLSSGSSRFASWEYSSSNVFDLAICIILLVFGILILSALKRKTHWAPPSPEP